MTGSIPSESIFASELSTAIVALVVSFVGVDTLMMPEEICLADKLLVAVLFVARKRVLPLLIVGLHV